MMENPHLSATDDENPARVQQELLYKSLDESDAALHARVQQVWPLDPEAAFGALPTPLRLHSDPRFTGLGTTIALIDTGFYPHPDLVQPANRIRAWVNTSIEPAQVIRYGADEFPKWPNWDKSYDRQWHGTMTAVTAAGNGHLSQGLYRGLASQADIVLIQARLEEGEIGDAGIRRALEWIKAEHASLNIRVVSISLPGERVDPLSGNPIDTLIEDLYQLGVTVVAAAGNDGVRSLIPPATAPHALTAGGLDDKNTFSKEDNALWHSNYGSGILGVPKPELVAPSIWVAAPILPGTTVAQEAKWLFEHRDEPGSAERMQQLKLITPDYQHVDGTSFAAPIIASTINCMLEANRELTPASIREILIQTATEIPNTPKERQGAGALEAGMAVAAALHYREHTSFTVLPLISEHDVLFRLHDHAATQVTLRGSWNGWQAGPPMTNLKGSWEEKIPRPLPGVYQYKFVINEQTWIDDPANPLKIPDGFGGFNSLLLINSD